MTDRGFSHIPVMLGETIDGLSVKEGGVYVDGTLGGGGHAEQILKKGGVLIGIDRDEAAIAAASKRLTGNYTLVGDNYSHIKTILSNLIIEKIDGALLDLGVSSHQLDTPGRGFSYRFDAPLDMRMDKRSDLTAKAIVNTYDIAQIERILFEYGEEPFARQIARKIGEYRAQQPIETTAQLVEIIKSAMPAKVKREGKHPAKRTFQAIRIAVNDELSQLGSTVEAFCDVLKSGGRLAVITFHSLEDRIVKNTFVRLAKGCDCPKDFPVCVCGKQPLIKQVSKKPIVASEEERRNNPRSESAKLRVVEKI